MNIDLRSVLVVAAVTEFLFAAMLASTWSNRRAPVALTYWSLGSFTAGLSCVVGCLRGQMPELLAIIGSNLLIFTSLGLRLAGLRSFAGQPVQLKLLLLPALLITLLFGFYQPLGLDVGQRVLIAGILGLGFGLRMLVELNRAQHQERLTMRHIVIFAIGLQTMNDVVRLLAATLGGFANNQYLDANTLFSILLLNVLCIYGVLNLACFMMMFERHENRLVRAASVDPLTGLLNRVGFQQLADRQRQRSARDGKPLSVLVMDLDWFKRINDRYGHEAGDAVLSAFAQTARAALRPTDLLSRPGGEEFWALLPQCALTEAERSAQRVCDGFRSVRVPHGDQLITATVSIGVAAVDLAAETIAAALARADQALYAAKHEGRDRFVTADARPAGLRAVTA